MTENQSHIPKIHPNLQVNVLRRFVYRSILPANNLQHICTTGHILYQGADFLPFYHIPGNNDMARLSRIQFHVRNVDTLH